MCAKGASVSVGAITPDAKNPKPKEKEEKEIHSKSQDNGAFYMKMLCLVSLTFQYAAYAQIYKYSRIGFEADLYITSSAVCISEVLKLFFSCLLMATYERSWLSFYTFFHESLVKRPLDFLNVGIPAIGYVITTNFIYIAGTNLDVITAQIVNQLKIPATVIFSMILLGSKFRKLQYLSLVLLMAGAAVVQMADVQDDSTKPPSDGNPSKKFLVPNKTLGIATGLIASCLSGFSGVYFERILKTTNPSVWARNVQLSVLSIPPALIQSYTYDWKDICEKGLFHGYTYVVWLVIFLQAFGGLIVALSMKLADNVSKGYATSASIVVSSISSTIIFHYTFNYVLVCGAALVVLSIPFYACTFKTSKIEPVKMDPEEGRECYI